MRKFALMWSMAALLLFLASAVCFAEDEGRRFVDARGDTGYFVDVTTVSIDSNHEYTADVAIIKAKENRLFSYRMHFDFAARTYQILRSATMTYDTREVSQSVKTPTPRAYRRSSLRIAESGRCARRSRSACDRKRGGSPLP